MATKNVPQDNDSRITRRGFIGTVGAVAAASALPAVALAGSASAAWREARPALLPALRAAYLAELERFAESLRPRFEVGELHAFRDEDERRVSRDVPHWKLEALAAAHFGLQVTQREEEGWGWYEGDAAAAYAVLAASPRAEATRNTQEHPCYHASEAAAWDTIALARERCWYVPTEDECGDPLEDAVYLERTA